MGILNYVFKQNLLQRQCRMEVHHNFHVAVRSGHGNKGI